MSRAQHNKKPTTPIIHRCSPRAGPSLFLLLPHYIPIVNPALLLYRLNHIPIEPRTLPLFKLGSACLRSFRPPVLLLRPAVHHLHPVITRITLFQLILSTLFPQLPLQRRNPLPLLHRLLFSLPRRNQKRIPLQLRTPQTPLNDLNELMMALRRFFHPRILPPRARKRGFEIVDPRVQVRGVLLEAVVFLLKAIDPLLELVVLVCDRSVPHLELEFLALEIVALVLKTRFFGSERRDGRGALVEILVQCVVVEAESVALSEEVVVLFDEGMVFGEQGADFLVGHVERRDGFYGGDGGKQMIQRVRDEEGYRIEETLVILYWTCSDGLEYSTSEHFFCAAYDVAMIVARRRLQ